MRPPERPSEEEAELDRLFSALSDPTRRAILRRLAVRSASVTELAAPFRMTLPAVSKHLKVLEEAHLLSRAVRGRVHSLSLSGEPLRAVETWLDPFRVYWETELTRLRADLERHPPKPPARRTRPA